MCFLCRSFRGWSFWTWTVYFVSIIGELWTINSISCTDFSNVDDYSSYYTFKINSRTYSEFNLGRRQWFVAQFFLKMFEKFFLFPLGHAVISFQLFEIPTQSPSNEQILNALRNLIDKQILNLIDPNRCLLHVICGSLVIGKNMMERRWKFISLFTGTKGEPINIKFFSLPNGDYLGEFTPKKIGNDKKSRMNTHCLF